MHQIDTLQEMLRAKRRHERLRGRATAPLPGHAATTPDAPATHEGLWATPGEEQKTLAVPREDNASGAAGMGGVGANPSSAAVPGVAAAVSGGVGVVPATVPGVAVSVPAAVPAAVPAPRQDTADYLSLFQQERKRTEVCCQCS